MQKIGVQTKNVITDENPLEGFELLKRAGFRCCDFSLNGYLKNTDIYQDGLNHFFDKEIEELTAFFRPHKEAAAAMDIAVSQMHMPYPIYVPGGKKALNEYLWKQVAPKSMELCHFFACPFIVIHGFKLARFLGSEEAEWQQTERFIHSIASSAKEYGITICIENLYTGVGGHLMEGPCCDARKAAERIDRINDRYGAEITGFCFDTGHANLIGLDMERFITTLGSRLKVLHIHDNDGVGDLHQLPFTFAKTRENRTSTDWEGFIRGLRAIRFQGVLSFETAPVLDAFPLELKQEALRFIVKTGEYFAKKIAQQTDSFPI